MLVPHVSHFSPSCSNLHLVLLIPSETLLTRFVNELAKNLALLLNCSM